jgi:hypothetical protein
MLVQMTVHFLLDYLNVNLTSFGHEHFPQIILQLLDHRLQKVILLVVVHLRVKIIRTALSNQQSRDVPVVGFKVHRHLVFLKLRQDGKVPFSEDIQLLTALKFNIPKIELRDFLKLLGDYSFIKHLLDVFVDHSDFEIVNHIVDFDVTQSVSQLNPHSARDTDKELFEIQRPEIIESLTFSRIWPTLWHLVLIIQYEIDLALISLRNLFVVEVNLFHFVLKLLSS